MINWLNEMVHVNESNIDGERLIVVPRWKVIIEDALPFIGAFTIAAACCLLVRLAR